MDSAYFKASRQRRKGELEELADSLELGAFKALSTGIGIGGVRAPSAEAKLSPEVRNLLRAQGHGSPAGASAGRAGAMSSGEAPAVATAQTGRTWGARAAAKGAKAVKSPPRRESAPTRRAPAIEPLIDFGGSGGGDAVADDGRQEARVVHEAPAARGGRGLEARLLAWGVDFLFVASSIGIALALAAVLAAARSGDGEGLVARNWLTLPPVQWLASYRPYEILAGVYGVYLMYHLLFRLLAGRTVGENLLGVARKPRRKKSGG